MERRVGTCSRGIRGPIIREGDNLVEITVDSVLAAAESEGFSLRDRDVIALTESIVARAQGNYVSVDAIAEDVKAKLGGETVGVIFPILSRNRFAINLKGIAMGCKKVVLMLSYPSDEVGNELINMDKIDEAGINPYSDVLSLEKEIHLYLLQFRLSFRKRILQHIDPHPRSPHLNHGSIYRYGITQLSHFRHLFHIFPCVDVFRNIGLHIFADHSFGHGRRMERCD